MSGPLDSPFQVLTGGGIVSTHPVRPSRTIMVAPTTDDGANTITDEFLPVACVRMDDVRFEFDSSFVGEDASEELKALDQLRHEIPGMAVSVFGHADPVGDDVYNKKLSGRRAQAIYGLLIRDPDLWDDLFKNPLGGDNWEWKAIQHMLTTLGFYSDDINGVLDKPTRKAISDFQHSPAGTGSTPDLEPFPKTRPKIYLAYMSKICIDGQGNAYQLDAVQDFVAQNSGKNGRGDYQGCSEFNPVTVFSTDEDTAFKKDADKTERDKQNQKNRRVLLYLFPPGRRADLSKWPCPAAKEGITACKDQFYKSDPKGDIRRNPRAQHREYSETRDTFACKFYDRFAAESPCEVGGLVVQTELVRVHLRLTYLDPEGNPLPFPPGLPVNVLYADGRIDNQTLAADGRLTFNADRRRVSFRLVYPAASATSSFVAHATGSTTGSGPERLLQESERDSALADNYKLFQLPGIEWSTATSEWVQGGSRVIDFTDFVSAQFSVGSDAAPVDVTLKPHWQYLRFFYFDRKLKQQLTTPPLFLQGFFAAPSGQNAPADTASNWTIGNPIVTQCVPWIVQTPPKPDKNIVIQLSTPDNTFIETVDQNTRRIVTGSQTHANAARLAFYDLPGLWKSTNYLVRLKSGSDLFQNLADQGLSATSPLDFILDDLVLVDDKGKPVAWKQGDPIAIFSNSLDLFNPDLANNLSFYTKQDHLPAGATARNYVSTYPNWVRVIVQDGNIHDVFEKRTSQGDVIGARAAIIVVPRTNTTMSLSQGFFTTIQPRFSQIQHEAISGDGSVGSSDQFFMRCCDAEGDTEIAGLMQYLRDGFKHVALTDPNDIKKWNDSVVRKVQSAWNNGNNVMLVPQKPSKDAPKVRFRTFVQPLDPSISHNTITVVAHQARGDAADWDTSFLNTVAGACIAIHETGHNLSLGDEYLETASCSLNAPGFLDNKVGLPFGDDGDAMMNGNKVIRPRHYWHQAEWLYANLMPQHQAYQVQRGNETPFLLPSQPNGVSGNFVDVPINKRINAANGGRGRFDLFLYPLGHEEYSDSFLGRGGGAQFDAILCVKVKMRCVFPMNKFGSIDSFLSDAEQEFRNKFQNLKFKIAGSTFKSCYIKVSARYLVENCPTGDDDYLASNFLYSRAKHPGAKTDAALWAATVQDIIQLEGNNWHYNVLVHDDPFFKPSRNFWQGGSPASKNTLEYEYSDEDDLWKFISEMLGLNNGEVPNATNFAGIASFVDGGTIVPL